MRSAVRRRWICGPWVWLLLGWHFACSGGERAGAHRQPGLVGAEAVDVEDDRRRRDGDDHDGAVPPDGGERGLERLGNTGSVDARVGPGAGEKGLILYLSFEYSLWDER